MIVGMAPGRDELAKDRPFVGGSGKLLWSLLKKVGIDRADCYIVNCIGEWPAKGSGKAISDDQWDRWWDRFDHAVSDFSGRAVVACGGDALWRLTGLGGGIGDWRGYLVHPSERRGLVRPRFADRPYRSAGITRGVAHKKGDIRKVKTKETTNPPELPDGSFVFPTLHPAGVLRTGFSEAPLLAADLRRVARFLRGELLPSRSAYVEYPVIFGRDSRAVAIDIETGGIDGGIIRFGCADEKDCWTAPWDERTRHAARSIMAQPDRTLIFHNASFDLPRLAAAGAARAGGRIFDTMLGAALLQPDFKKGLNSAASFYLDCQRWKHLADDHPARYNAIDNIREFELWQQEVKLLEATNQLGLFENIIMRTTPYLIQMTTDGIRLDPVRQAEWVRELETEGSRKLAEWNKLTDGVDFASPTKLKNYFRSLGMDLRLNKYGAESTDKQALAALKADYPDHRDLFDLLQKVRTTFKDLATFAGNVSASDGRIHADFIPVGKDMDAVGKGLAGTWRITSRGPNLQNQPTRARRMYVPSPGMVFVGADYSQLEARILAVLSGDAVLLEDCNKGIHNANAARLGVDKTRAKNGFYGWSYMAGPRTLYNTFLGYGYRVPMAECQALLDGFDRTYKRAAAFRQEAIKLAKAKRYVENPFGLRRYFPQMEFPSPSAMSTLIQSTGAMMMWTIIPMLAEQAKLHDGRLLLTVHDDVLLEVPEEWALWTLGAVQGIMEMPFDFWGKQFSCPVTPKLSRTNWGEMEEVSGKA